MVIMRYEVVFPICNHPYPFRIICTTSSRKAALDLALVEAWRQGKTVLKSARRLAKVTELESINLKDPLNGGEQ